MTWIAAARRGPNRWSLLVLVVGLLLTVLTTRASLQSAAAEQHADFLVEAERLTDTVGEQLTKIQFTLRQALAAYRAAGNLDRPGFTRYVELLDAANALAPCAAWVSRSPWDGTASPPGKGVSASRCAAAGDMRRCSG